MNNTPSSISGGSIGIVAVVAMVLGALVAGYGLLLLPVSALGGIHVAAIGVSLLLAGLFTTEWAGERWNLSPATRRRLSWGFLALGALLLVTFVVLNFATFEGSVVESGSEGGN